MNLAWQQQDDSTAAVSNIEPNTFEPNSKDKTNHPSISNISKYNGKYIYELSSARQ